MNLRMVDLKGQYEKIKEEVDKSIQETLDNTAFINGPKVKAFAENLSKYVGSGHVIPCANGTDALQIAMMALNLKPGDEVIVPAFTYVATAEVIALLKLSPVMVDVDYDSFNTCKKHIEPFITHKTKAIVPVHLYGQTSPMQAIMELAEKYNLFVIEDAAQSIGSDYHFKDGRIKKSGTIGHIGCTSFFPSKNLGCYGDGGALFTEDEALAQKISRIANHGQSKRYYHDSIGVNSRLDAIQAGILDIKLKHLDEYGHARQKAADHYDESFAKNPQLITPQRVDYSSHVFHQYTLKVQNGTRNELSEFLNNENIPHNIYYPLPLYAQKAFADFPQAYIPLENTEKLCKEVISLPMHTELTGEMIEYIADKVNNFFGV